MADISANYKRVCAESESPYGTDRINEILTTGTLDIIYQDVRMNFDITPVVNIAEIDRARGSQSGVAHKTIPDRCTVAGDVALTGRAASGAGNEAPFYAAFLKACGMKETIVSDTSATYRPATPQQAGATMYLWTRNLDDNNWRLVYTTGCRGSANFQFNVNQEAFFSFTGIGRFEGMVSDPAAFFNATTGAAALLEDGTTPVTARSGGGVEQFAAKDPLVCTNMTVTIGGNTYCVQALNLDLGWTTDVKDCMGAASNVRTVYNTRGAAQRIAGSFTLIDGATAHDQVRDAYRDGDELAFSIVLTSGDGASGSDRVTISGSKMQIGVVSKAAAGGVQSNVVPFFLNGDWSDLAQDDDFAIVYDEVP